MKFSEQWLREWVNPDCSTEELVELLTMAGLEVDSVAPAAAAFSGVVVAEVLEVSPHPDADKLRVCKVNAGGDAPLQIVCGAPNVAAGMKVPCAMVGGSMPEFKIKKAKLRGVESFGMLCSAKELGLSEDHAGLMALPEEAAIGEDVRDYLELNDQLIEVDLTPNRGDCLGILGLAREVGVLTRTQVDDFEIAEVPTTIEDTFPVTVTAPQACPRYLGRVIRGVDARAVTPLWMQESLRRSGLRSLGPVVDVTNYVLLELGQPMHAFDLAQLRGGIEVRFAKPGETLTLLDGNEVSMDAETLVIADQDKALALAGVMGGAHSGVADDTTDLFLECAFFSPETIAGRARRYGLVTDSSFRFERGVDPELQRLAMERATDLLLELVGGRAGPVVEAVASKHLPVRQPIVLRAARIQRLLGLAPEAAEVEDILGRLGMSLERTEGGWIVEPPSFRFDIALEADLIEEVGRVFGYNRLPSSQLQGGLSMSPVPEARVPLDRLRAVLVERGYQEAITYSFVDPTLQAQLDPDTLPVALANPISSEMSVMRTSLWPGLIKALQHNLHRQQGRVRLFEQGLRFIKEDNEITQENVISGVVTGHRLGEQWSVASSAVDFFDVKADVEALLAAGQGTWRFEAASLPALHPGQSARLLCGGAPAGWLGCLHPQLAKSLDLPEKTYLFEIRRTALEAGRVAVFEAISRYPSIRRDLALVVDEGVQAQAIRDVVEESAQGLLKELVCFDVYQGQGVEIGRKSLAIGLILQDSSRTLAEEDVSRVMERVMAHLEQQLGAQLRD